jgi:hypothetical protein
MKAHLLATALVLMSAPALSQEADIWRACSIDSVMMCTPAGCSGRAPGISIYIGYYSRDSVKRALYLRCAVGLVSCDRYDPVVRRNGAFMIFSLPERSVFSKLGTDNSLLDVAGVKESVVISRGRCTEAAPPLSSRWRSRQD